MSRNKGMVLSEKNIHLVVHRLQQFFGRYEHISFQNFYNRVPLSGKKHPWRSDFLRTIEKSCKHTVGGDSVVRRELYKRFAIKGGEVEELILVIKNPGFSGRIVFRVGDRFYFKPNKVVARTSTPISRTSTDPKCDAVITPGTWDDHLESLNFEEESRKHYGWI